MQSYVCPTEFKLCVLLLKKVAVDAETKYMGQNNYVVMIFIRSRIGRYSVGQNYERRVGLLFIKNS